MYDMDDNTTDTTENALDKLFMLFDVMNMVKATSYVSEPQSNYDYTFVVESAVADLKRMVDGYAKAQTKAKHDMFKVVANQQRDFVPTERRTNHLTIVK
jgi:hypothetical protein